MALFIPATRTVDRPGIPPPGAISGVVAPAGSPAGTLPEAPVREAPEDLAINLIEALVAWIDGQPSIVEMFPRGIFMELGPFGSPETALVFKQKTSRLLHVIGQPWTVEWCEIEIEAQSEYAQNTRRLAERVRDMILAGPAFAWQGGRELDRYETDGSGGKMEKVPQGEGAVVWVHTIPIVFMTVKD